MTRQFFVNGRAHAEIDRLVISSSLDPEPTTFEEVEEAVLRRNGIISFRVGGCTFQPDSILVTKDFMKFLRPEFRSELESARLWLPSSKNVSPRVGENIKFHLHTCPGCRE